MSKTDRFSFLLLQYLSGNISAAEHDEFFELINTREYDSLLAEAIQNDLDNGIDTGLADIPPHIAQEIVRNIYSAEKNTAQIIPLRKKPGLPRLWVAAAAVLFLVIGSYFIYQLNMPSSNAGFTTSLIPPGSIIEKNTGSAEKEIRMPDGSVIALKPNSEIHYLNDYNDSTREVYLLGEAFFKVSHNPAKPFLVYYNNIVTKVLGTSFAINTNAETGNLEVTVKTGRVQVSENTKLPGAKQLANTVIVTPNQKAIYRVEKGVFETTLVNAPEPISRTAGKPDHVIAEQFSYENEKLSSIFRHLEAVYGIEINTENARLDNCVFTGDVSGHDLFTKLKIICLATNSNYVVNGTRIVINGTGCH